jgi:hypothetical protein
LNPNPISRTLHRKPKPEAPTQTRSRNAGFTTYGDEDAVKSCIATFQGHRELTDPANPDNGQGWHT